MPQEPLSACWNIPTTRFRKKMTTQITSLTLRTFLWFLLFICTFWSALYGVPMECPTWSGLFEVPFTPKDSDNLNHSFLLQNTLQWLESSSSATWCSFVKCWTPPELWIEVRPSCKSGHEWEIPQMRPLLEVVTLRREDPPKLPLLVFFLVKKRETKKIQKGDPIWVE